MKLKVICFVFSFSLVSNVQCILFTQISRAIPVVKNHWKEFLIDVGGPAVDFDGIFATTDIACEAHGQLVIFMCLFLVHLSSSPFVRICIP